MSSKCQYSLPLRAAPSVPYVLNEVPVFLSRELVVLNRSPSPRSSMVGLAVLFDVHGFFFFLVNVSGLCLPYTKCICLVAISPRRSRIHRRPTDFGLRLAGDPCRRRYVGPCNDRPAPIEGAHCLCVRGQSDTTRHERCDYPFPVPAYRYGIPHVYYVRYVGGRA